jgi:hypothetical protein
VSADRASAHPGRPEARVPLRSAVDISLGDSAEVELWNGDTARVQLLDLQEKRDTLRGAVRSARVRVRVNGEETWVASGGYHLPQAVAGIRIDCAVTGGYRQDRPDDPWGLEKDARLRLWPSASTFIEPGTFAYPAQQLWFATETQMTNEPCYTLGAEGASKENIYYHDGLDIGGAEGLVEVVAATEGLVLSRGTEAVDGIAEYPCEPRYDRVYLLDRRGWVCSYAHLKSIHEGVRLGEGVALRQPLGVLGKEGTSGGWSHLHFGIFSRLPSGRWGVEEGYPYLWEAYLAAYQPAVIAVARPHHLLATGETAVLDGSRSWCRHPEGIRQYEWRFTDGSTASEPRVGRAYAKAGVYSEILKVTGADGSEGYDFAVVQVFDDYDPDHMPPGIHAVYAPTFGLRPGDLVTFGVRSSGVVDGGQTWDFGDGSPPVAVKAVPVKRDGSTHHSPDGYAFTVHRYSRAGDYLTSVTHTGTNGLKATARLHVRVGGGHAHEP